MSLKFKDLMSEIATDTSENAKFSAEDIQGVIDEVTAKDTEIVSLKAELEKRNKEHEDLKNRIVDKLFNNPKGNPTEVTHEEDVETEQEIKTFDELILPDFKTRN